MGTVSKPTEGGHLGLSVMWVFTSTLWVGVIMHDRQKHISIKHPVSNHYSCEFLLSHCV